MTSPIDIVIPLYNKAATIGRAIQSIQAQTHQNWRLIVVDDGSTDSSADIVKQFQQNDPRIDCLTQPNQGPGTARNNGIRAATAPYVAFLDGDDAWYPDYLHNGLQPFDQNEVTMVASFYDEQPSGMNMTAFWKNKGVEAGCYHLTGREDPVQVEALLSFMHVGTTLVKRDRALKYGGYYENGCRYAEDTVFFMRLGINEPFLIIPQIGACHYRSDSELSHMTEKPLPPHLKNPDVILNYCQGSQRDCMAQVIDYLAIHRARYYARQGRKSEAVSFLQQFPGAARAQSSRVQQLYRQCQRDILFSPFMPGWVRFKMAIRRLLGLSQ